MWTGPNWNAIEEVAAKAQGEMEELLKLDVASYLVEPLFTDLMRGIGSMATTQALARANQLNQRRQG